MDDPFRTNGSLTAVLGEGYLSAFEVGALKPGDLVRTSRAAGVPHTVLYNGLPLAQGEAVILSAAAGGSVFGIRISDTDFPSPFAVGPVRKDEVGEFLPFLVSLGSIQVSLAELEGVGVNSLIGLGAPWSQEEDADLLVAGFPIARGKVVAIGEEMGLRITRIVARPSAVPTVASSGYLIDRATAAHLKVKDYDFRRPDKFSKQQITRIRDTHALFLQNLRARVPELGEAIQIEPYPYLVDQCTMAEAAQQMSENGLQHRLVVENRPWRRAPREAEDRTSTLGRFRVLVEEAGSRNPVDPRVKAYAEEYLNAESLANRNAIFLFHGDDAALRRAMVEGRDAVLACLRAAWRTIVELNPVPVAEEEAERIGSIPPNDMVIVVAFTLRASKKPFLSLVYPYLTLEPFARLLSR